MKNKNVLIFFEKKHETFCYFKNKRYLCTAIEKQMHS